MVKMSNINPRIVEGLYCEALVLSDEVRATTGEYFDEMDPVGMFARDCVEEAEGQDVPARDMFLAYKRWAEASAKRVRSETYFGTVMRKKGFIKRDMRIERRSRIAYVNVRLVNVPEPTPFPSVSMSP